MSRIARGWAAAAVCMLALVMQWAATPTAEGADLGTPAESQAEPQPGHPLGRVVLVGDSIMAGAADQLEAAFRSAGYEVVVDATESRSTVAGAAVASRHLGAGGADAIVVMLGANDGASADSYRERVRAVVQATAFVPRIYWLTVPEVRGYYPAANQVVREELALRRGSEVLDWAAVGSSTGLTAGDGLHLSGAGADAMAWFVSANVVGDLRADAAAAASTTTTATTTTTASTSASPSNTAPTTSPTPVASVIEEGEAAAETAADSSIWRFAAGTMVAAVGLLAVLAALGASLAVWSLWRTRGAA